MKFALRLVSAVLLVVPCFCGLLQASKGRLSLGKFLPEEGNGSQVGLDKCKVCLDFADDAINVLLNEILQVGIVGTCGELCGALPKQAEQAICNILCDVVGIEEFVKVIEKADIDPIYYCELLKECPIKDDGDAKITQIGVTPKSGPQGDFDITFEYTSVNGTGTGEIDIDIDTVDKIPLGQAFLHEIAPAGTYPGTIKLRAQPDPDCDPTQGPCEEWQPGVYTVKIAICNGECGSQHPHSQVYDQASTTFTITG